MIRKLTEGIIDIINLKLDNGKPIHVCCILYNTNCKLFASHISVIKIIFNILQKKKERASKVSYLT